MDALKATATQSITILEQAQGRIRALEAQGKKRAAELEAAAQARAGLEAQVAELEKHSESLVSAVVEPLVEWAQVRTYRGWAGGAGSCLWWSGRRCAPAGGRGGD